MIELSIILVNWNCLAYTEQCLASIRDTAGELDYEVIVVDNDSADAPCQGLVESHPWIRLILSKRNIGFGRANNLGVQYSRGRMLLFLNPDTIVLGDAIQRMLSALDAVHNGGAIGCRLLNPDGSLQMTSVQPFPTIANQLLALNWIQQRWPALPLWGKSALYTIEPKIVQDVDFVSGAAILVKRDVFEQVGGFNPAYFMFAEEADLCFAIHQAGFRVLHTGEARILHFGGQSTKNREDNFAAVMMRDSVYRFLCRNRGNMYGGMYRIALIASGLSRLIVLIGVLPFAACFDYPITRQDVLRPLRKWLRIVQWAAGWDIKGSLDKSPEASTAPAEN